MGKINIKNRLRPIRFAFLVDIDDRESLQKVFEINTCLWGGIYNSIIPFFEKVPSIWKRECFIEINKNPLEIRQGYIKYFEPDFIVETKKGQAKNLKVAQQLIIGIDELNLLIDSKRGRQSYGMNIIEVYRDLYHKEFKFVRKQNIKICMVEAKNDSDKLFASCNWGAFPREESLKYMGATFSKIFSPELIELDELIIKDLYENEYISALNITSEHLKLRFYDSRRPKILVLDSSNLLDLIDFWNMRAYEQEIVAIPMHWIDSVKDYCHSYIENNNLPYRENHNGIKIDTTIVFSRSIETDKANDIYRKYIPNDFCSAAICQLWMPSIWENYSGHGRELHIPIVTAQMKSTQIDIDRRNDSIKFDQLSPSFADQFGNEFRWANVLNLEETYHISGFPLVFPNNRNNINFLTNNMQLVLTTKEGVVIFPQFKDQTGFWPNYTGQNLFIEWFNTKGIKAEINNPSGKTISQMMDMLGGPSGFNHLASCELIKLLNGMARNLKTISSNNGKNEKIQSIEFPGKTICYNEFKNKLNDIKFWKHWKEKWLDFLTDKNVIKLGVEIGCSSCGGNNWYPLNALNYSLKCDHCTQQYDFPVAKPDGRNVNYSYKIVGPFSRPEFADGAYTVGLSIRVFSNLLGVCNNKVTWAPSLKLKIDGKELETDFLLWYQYKRSFEINSEVEVVFGECKSFAKNGFSQPDIERMQLLATTFPGSIIVFSTLKDELTESEIKLISDLALWGREEHTNGISRAPVIVLTGTELFSIHQIQMTWKVKGGKYEPFIENQSRIENLRSLANVTQQLYLDLPSYGAWIEEGYKKKDT